MFATGTSSGILAFAHNVLNFKIMLSTWGDSTKRLSLGHLKNYPTLKIWFFIFQVGIPIKTLLKDKTVISMLGESQPKILSILVVDLSYLWSFGFARNNSRFSILQKNLMNKSRLGIQENLDLSPK